MFVYAYRYRLLNFFYHFFDREYTLDTLTTEQKIEDFYVTITESVPFLQDVKNLYGIDFVDRKEYYL